jgi:hypothetical protein
MNETHRDPPDPAMNHLHRDPPDLAMIRRLYREFHSNPRKNEEDDCRRESQSRSATLRIP